MYRRGRVVAVLWWRAGDIAGAHLPNLPDPSSGYRGDGAVERLRQHSDRARSANMGMLRLQGLTAREPSTWPLVNNGRVNGGTPEDLGEIAAPEDPQPTFQFKGGGEIPGLSANKTRGGLGLSMFVVPEGRRQDEMSSAFRYLNLKETTQLVFL